MASFPAKLAVLRGGSRRERLLSCVRLERRIFPLTFLDFRLGDHVGGIRLFLENRGSSLHGVLVNSRLEPCLL
ncbi:hypothetical protein ANAPC5_01119 [Anaplasma phagocytophilum]|nr:hypothetical protein ANAPC5_01119 [Anaplasma phagocytophilum]